MLFRGSRLAGLASTMLAPSYPLSKSLKNPALLDSLRTPSGFTRVPQTPLNVVGACASSSIAFSEIAPQMVLDYPGFRRPQLVLWTAADAATRPHWQILDAFGPGALMTRAKLDALNASRSGGDIRSVSDALAPFDVDANGTVVGEGGSGVLITTLDFALRNFLDITSIIVAAFVVNELKDNDRTELLRNLIGNQERGTRNGGRRVLIIEPISQRISPWWDQWAAEFIKRGGRADVWKARIAPPPMVKRLAKASGLRPEMLTAKSLFL